MPDTIQSNSNRPSNIPPRKNMVRLFINAAGREGNALMGGGLLAFGLAIWQAAIGSLSAVALIIVAGGLFGWGAYLAFAKEHALLEQEQAKNSKPEFLTDVEVLHLADSQPTVTVAAEAWGGKQHVMHTYRIIVRVSIVNLRPPASSVKNFKLTLTTKSGGHVATLEPVVPIEQHFELLTPGSTFGNILTSADTPYLMDSIKGKKLEQGNHETGWLGFTLRGELLQARDLEYDMTVIDGYGDSHPVSFDSVYTTEAVYSASRRL